MAKTSSTKTDQSLFLVVSASSVGTLIEWYDFYIFGSLATIISFHFFPAGNPTAALLSTLATFAAGFVVRPFGAVFFGRLGDLVGRKYTFMLTLAIMGLSTFLIGLVPDFGTIGYFAPLLVLILRLLQGLALGGEYGGATTYVGEHAPKGRRGFFTSWIQTTATLGLLISLLVILATRSWLGETTFNDWGWRIPFLISIFLFAISVYIRLRMKESPLFENLKKEGKVSKNPLKESFVHKENLKYVLLALLGATMGQGVVWYTGQFYALSFIQKAGVEFTQTNYIVLIALLMGTPLFIFFGWLSDLIGRKWIMLVGMVLAVLTYQPIYRSMLQNIEVKNKTVVAEQSTTVTNQVEEGAKKFELVVANNVYTDGSTQTLTKKTEILDPVVDAGKKPTEMVKNVISLGSSSYWALVWLIFIQVVYVTMVYGPIAAFLIELFPTKIRYTSLSLPYHIGNGVFGGLVPFIATALVVQAQASGSADFALAGLWYPMGVAAVCAVICFFYLNHRSYNRAED